MLLLMILGCEKFKISHVDFFSPETVQYNISKKRATKTTHNQMRKLQVSKYKSIFSQF